MSDRDARDDNSDDSPDDATRYTITGKIDAKKTGRVNGTDFLIVRVKQRDDQSVVVDLGPAENWSEIKLQVDDSISATGSMEKIGDKAILMAEVATISQKQIRIERPSPTFTGTVEEVTSAKVSDSQHVFVVVATQDGNQIVDLGPVDSLKVTVTPKAKIVVHGVPVRMHDHQVVLAEQIDLDGHSHSIPRWK